MKNTSKLAAALIAGLGLTLAGQSAAQATEQPTLTTVLWEVTSTTEDVFLTPQKYTDQYAGDWLGKWDNPTSGLKCGTKYQADVYPTGEVAKLIEDGLLYGGEDHGIAQHWYVWTTPACEVVVPPVEPPIEEPPTEEPPVEQPPVEEPPVVVPPTDEPPVVTPPVEEPPVVAPPVAEQPPVAVEPVVQPREVVATEQIPAKVNAPVLAQTGFDTKPTLIAGLLLLLVGASVGVARKLKKA